MPLSHSCEQAELSGALAKRSPPPWSLRRPSSDAATEIREFASCELGDFKVPLGRDVGGVQKKGRMIHQMGGHISSHYRMIK
jgi:hypothetical protein